MTTEQQTLGSTVKLPTWRRQLIPVDEEERAWIQQVVVEAVFSVWNQFGRPTDLAEIYRVYRQRCNAEGQKVRSKRTVDRRVNEAASPEFGARIVSNTSGMYQPSPALFMEEG